MINNKIALLISFVAMLMYASSYVFKKKSTYLMFQGFGCISLVFSYLFMGEYFAMISLLLGLSRTIIYFMFEKKDRAIPAWIVVLNCVVLFLNYLIVNVLILKSANFADILLVISFCLYAIVFSFRNLQRVRYTITIPLALTVLYNILIAAPIFTVISYSFELLVAIGTIIYYSKPSKH